MAEEKKQSPKDNFLVDDDLVQTKNFYENLLDSVKEGVWVSDKNNVIYYANNGMTVIAGGSKEDMIGKNVLTDFSSESIIEFKEFYLRAQKNLKPTEYHARITNLNEQYTYQTGWLIPLLKAGEFDGMICSTLDTTEHHQNRELIRKSEEQLRNIIDHSTNAFYSHTINHELTYFSPQIEEILGYKPEETYGNWKNLTSKNPINDTASELTELAIKTGKTQAPYEVELIHRNGSLVRAIVHEAPVLKDGKTTAIVGSLTDITNRREVERNLQENEIRFQNIVQNLNGIVYRCQYDEKWTMIFLSDGVKKLTGYDSTEIILNKKLSYNEIIHPDDREEVSKKVNSMVDVGQTFQLEYRLITNTGETKWVFEQGSGIRNLSGELTHLEGYIFDISERKQMELEIIQKNEEILSVNKKLANTINQVQTINHQLKEAKLKAEESDHLKSAFLANMSHEIRTPMNSIIGFSKLLTNEELEDHKRTKFSALILTAGEHLLRIIDDIIDVAKIESNQLKIEKSTIQIFKFLEGIYNDHKQSKLLEKNEKLELILRNRVISRSLKVFSDPIRLKQLFDNLLTNAIKYSKEGEIEFGIHSTDPIRGFITFYVKDNGIGIPDDFKEQVFNRFLQIDNELPKNQGTGLGLSITKGIAELLEGDIWFESTEDVGSVFFFKIPWTLEKAEEHSPLTRPQNKSRSLKGKTIYIAEDDYPSFLYLFEVLSPTEAEIIHFRDGKLLTEALRESSPDLIYVDMNMPVMNGLEAVQLIRTWGYKGPIVAQTANAMAEERERCEEAGCDDYMAKPASIKTILDITFQYLA